MLGRNHVIANVATLTIIGCTGALVANAGSPHVSEAVNSAKEWLMTTPQGSLHTLLDYDVAQAGSDPENDTWMARLLLYVNPVWLSCLAWLALDILGFVVGSFLPDIDSTGSVFGGHIDVLGGHRGITHTIYPVLIFLFIGLFIRPFAWLALGYFGHIFWDTWSRCGVSWFQPVNGYIHYKSGVKIKRGHRLWLYRVGSLSEYVVTGVLVAVAVFLVWYTKFACGV